MPTWIAHWLRDTRLLLASQLLVVLTTAALAIILARSWGPSDWGLFSALLGLSLALSTFVDLGLGTWLLCELSQLHERGATLAKRHHEGSRRISGAVLANGAFGSVLFVGTVVVLALVQAEIGTAIALLGSIAYTVFSRLRTALRRSFERSEGSRRSSPQLVWSDSCRSASRAPPCF
jgi:hypothetical protein